VRFREGRGVERADGCAQRAQDGAGSFNKWKRAVPFWTVQKDVRRHFKVLGY
jgi:hypothetical protein